MSPMVHKVITDGVEDPDKVPTFAPVDPAGHVDHPALREDEEAAPVDFFDQMAAEREAMLAAGAQLRIHWPGWNKTLVAVFEPLESTKIDRLLVAVRVQDGGKTEKNRALILGMLAESCVSLHYKGTLVDSGRGFGANMVRVLKAPQGSSIGHLAWLALKQDDTLLGPFVKKVQEWMEDPSPQDLVADPDDPFGDASAPPAGQGS